MRTRRFIRPLVAAMALLAISGPRTAVADSLLATPPATEAFDVGSLHVERFGSGPSTLILIPGLASGTWTWSRTIARELPTHTVYALTLAGFDGRPAPAEAPSFAGFDRDVQSLLAARSIRRPVVIGHSLGGTLAIMLAETHPTELRAIVAVDGLPIFPPLVSATPAERRAAADRAASPLAGAGHDALLSFDRSYMASVGTGDPALVEPVATLLATSDAKTEAAWLTEDLTTDLRADLPAIAIPFAEIMPYDDRPASGAPVYTLDQTIAFYTSLLAGAPHAHVLPIEHSRHFVMLDQPEAFAKTLDTFLATLQP